MQNLYSHYFGLKEASFSITPDPQYLFLSEQHREALAHLFYGAGTSGGFVLLTGEVGTGKTTICRAFLEQLPDAVEVALILNPATTVTELLRTVCDELRIEVSEQERTVKCLVDRLNDYLLRAHAAGRRAVLMIDEAQDLRPPVLEQVRLLTNLETPKHKLLQIFLIGQPELRTLLQREGLRQLNQRITARYHLRPFNAVETAEYIRHRLAVAGVERQLFTRDAIRLVHRVSGGVPRLINILCDRSLLGACVTHNPLVTKSIIKQAAHEVKDVAQKRHGSGLGRLAMITAALLLAVAGGWMTHSWLAGGPVATSYVPAFLARRLPLRQAEPSTTSETTLEQTSGLAAAKPETDGPGADVILADLALDRASAIRVLLRRWGVELTDLGPGDPCRRVMDYGLRCEFDDGGWSRMRFFDRPAVIELATGDPAERYLAVGALAAEAAILDLDEGRQRVSLTALDAAWDGEYLLLWQPPPVGSAIIGPGSRGESVRWLRKLLSQVPDTAFEAIGSGTFDPALDEAVRRFQKREGLAIDGIAGPKTLIRLHNAVGMPEIPKLVPVP